MVFVEVKAHDDCEQDEHQGVHKLATVHVGQDEVADDAAKEPSGDDGDDPFFKR